MVKSRVDTRSGPHGPHGSPTHRKDVFGLWMRSGHHQLPINATTYQVVRPGGVIPLQFNSRSDKEVCVGGEQLYRHTHIVSKDKPRRNVPNIHQVLWCLNKGQPNKPKLPDTFIGYLGGVEHPRNPFQAIFDLEKLTNQRLVSSREPRLYIVDCTPSRCFRSLLGLCVLVLDLVITYGGHKDGVDTLRFM